MAYGLNFYTYHFPRLIKVRFSSVHVTGPNNNKIEKREQIRLKDEKKYLYRKYRVHVSPHWEPGKD